MRAFAAVLVVLSAGVSCGQKVDHPDLAPGCEPGECFTPPEGAQGGGKAGARGSGDGEAVAPVSGQVRTFADDFFDRGASLATGAQISALGKRGARVTATYDGRAFTMEEVLKTAGNWFLVEPAAIGLLPTLQPVDTRTATSDGLTLGVAQNVILDGMFSLLGTERSTERAQIVLRVVDDAGASVPGVYADLTAERIAYRTASAWLAHDEGTDDSGMIFLANVQVASALTTVTVALTGRASASARVPVAIQGGVTTVGTVVVARK